MAIATERDAQKPGEPSLIITIKFSTLNPRTLTRAFKWNYGDSAPNVWHLNQLSAETRDNDAYKFAGLVSVNRPYAVNGLNQYTTAGPASFT